MNQQDFVTRCREFVAAQEALSQELATRGRELAASIQADHRNEICKATGFSPLFIHNLSIGKQVATPQAYLRLLEASEKLLAAV
ncbi:MAG: hypothetical protein CMK32_07785 [Porticoccaceae bacterium]|nr:hypothetical protein [Porticoccaceae bacterium]